MRRHLLKTIATLLLACASIAAGAQVPGDSVRVSIVNIAPGSDIYELEGHTVLRVQVPSVGYDAAVSYGTFDFDAPNFAYRFVKGEANYWMEVLPWMYLEEAYRTEGRTMREHHLDLDSVQAERLMQMLRINILPENRSYRYNYVKDNCATRPVAIVERAIGDTISFPKPQIDGVDLSTYRKVMRYYHRHYPWYQLGIDMVLGSGIDYPISAHEAIFAPTLLDKQLPGATVAGRPLVASSETILDYPDKTLPPTPWFLTPLSVFWLVFAAVAAISWRDIRRKRPSRWLDTLLYSAFGLVGLLITFLIFVSVHEATSPNWQYLWLNPLCLIMPVLVWWPKGHKVLNAYCWLNLTLITAMCVLWPLFGQEGNSALIPLVLVDIMRSGLYIYINKTEKKP